ncbi:MAG: VWA domain-containing protein, partial [Verrucomicrobiota bacterium]
GGGVKLESVKMDELPEELRKLSADELKAHVEKQQKQRAALQAEVMALSKQREAFLAAERKRLAASSKGDSFDEKVAETVRAQAARKGIRYEK